MRAAWVIACAMIKELIRKKDFYVLLIFMLILLGLLASQSFFQLEGVSRYLRDIGYSLVMLFSFIVAVTFSARQIPVEIESRTIYALLAKPISRSRVILGKFLGCMMISVISFSFYFAVYLAFYILETGISDLVLLGQAFFFGILFMFLVPALVIFFSNFVTLSANVMFSFLLYFIVTGFSDTIRDAVAASKGITSAALGVLYYFLPHFDFFDLRVRITHEWDPLPAWVVFAVAFYTVAYCFILLYFSGKLFERKKF
jgi:ABC-type transport system involved in multi-copper enzyme maturation permease subunit